MSFPPWSAAEQAQYSPNTAIFLPPPPARDGRPVASPARRGNVSIPPPLTIDAALPRVFLTQTPISATSWSGPFTPSYVSSPGPSPRTLGPMAARLSSNYTAPYDPREWAGGSRRASMVLEGRHNVTQPEDGMASPPPPYSAPQTREAAACTSAGSTISPADSTFTSGHQSQANTPTSTVGVLSPVNHASNLLSDGGLSGTNNNGTQYLNRPLGRTAGFDTRPSRLSTGSQLVESRPSSSLSVTRPHSSIMLSINTAAAQHAFVPAPLQGTQFGDGSLPAAPAARRAASTGAVSSHESLTHSYDGSTSRSSSRQRSWQPGMPLPGPPPGLPPPSSRSQSATGARMAPQAQAAGPSTRLSHHRVPLRPPILSPFPPTPANWRDESTSRSNSRAPAPLHIETTNLDRPSSLSGGLSRSAALRVSSAKGLLERRKHRQSVHEGLMAELSALTIDTDPWFDAMSPSGLSIDYSPTLESGAPGPSSPVHRRGVRTSSKSSYPSHLSNDGDLSHIADISPIIPRAGNNNPLVPPKALPTPPLSQKNTTSAHSILPSNASSVADLIHGESNAFILEANHRHHSFLLRESQANTDLERLQLFTEFIVKEAQIRRQRYPAPFVEGTFDASDSKQRLFAENAEDGDMETPALSGDKDELADEGAAVDLSQRSDTLWWKDYRPALSPIASMSNDEISSRGRTASRWWQSQTGSETDGGTKKMKRTKRESKYMGLSALSLEEVLSEGATPTIIDETYQTGDTYPDDKANPEAFGVYQVEPGARAVDRTLQSPFNTTALDISRFITLPPPYPRHHPGINNSHPTLSTYRSAVRTLSDLSEVERRRSRHNVSVEALRTEHKRKTAEEQRSFKANIQAQINEGSITYAEAGEAEQALRLEEHMSEKACLQSEFDTLQDVVINPMHDMLQGRAVQLSAHISELTEKLVEETRTQNPDRPQQEGDAMPELLEYLTQLKWLFETREHIHKEVFDLLSERNDKYKAIVLLPYRQAHNLDKIRDTEDFFARDSFQRQKPFYEQSLARYRDFAELVADNVGKEVDLQSSAFWDIAPGLLSLVQKIPDDFDHLGPIAIPEAEYVENPVYYRFPQQYLYTLLDHAEKSTYQFIESQISLHCLLHEVKGSLLGAEFRTAEVSKAREALEGPVVGADPQAIREAQEKSATAELKQQVTMIEQQWLEALGSALQGKKTQVRGFLESVGGWDESLQGE